MCLNSTFFRYSARSPHPPTKPSRGWLRVVVRKPRLVLFEYRATRLTKLSYYGESKGLLAGVWGHAGPCGEVAGCGVIFLIEGGSLPGLCSSLMGGLLAGSNGLRHLSSSALRRLFVFFIIWHFLLCPRQRSDTRGSKMGVRPSSCACGPVLGLSRLWVRLVGLSAYAKRNFLVKAPCGPFSKILM